MRNSAEFIYAVFAIAKVGAISLSINTFLKEGELAYILEDSGAKMLIGSMVHEKVLNHDEVQQHIELTLWEGETTRYNTHHVPFNQALTFPNTVESSHAKITDLAVIINCPKMPRARCLNGR